MESQKTNMVPKARLEGIRLVLPAIKQHPYWYKKFKIILQKILENPRATVEFEPDGHSYWDPPKRGAGVLGFRYMIGLSEPDEIVLALAHEWGHQFVLNGREPGKIYGHGPRQISFVTKARIVEAERAAWIIGLTAINHDPKWLEHPVAALGTYAWLEVSVKASILRLPQDIFYLICRTLGLTKLY